MYTLNLPVEDKEVFLENLAERENVDILLYNENEIVDNDKEEITCQY